MRPPRTFVNTAMLGAAALLLSACPVTVDAAMKDAEPYECPPAECDPPIPQGPGGTLVVEAYEFGFTIVEDVTAEGEIEVTLINVGSAEHDIRFEGAPTENDKVPADGVAAPGETVEGVVELFSGTYTYYCTVPGHRQAGMFGEIDIPLEPEEIGQAPGEEGAGDDPPTEDDDDTDE